MTRPSALFDKQGREKLAMLIVWGSKTKERLISREQIRVRLVSALERIAKSLEGQDDRMR